MVTQSEQKRARKPKGEKRENKKSKIRRLFGWLLRFGGKPLFHNQNTIETRPSIALGLLFGLLSFLTVKMFTPLGSWLPWLAALGGFLAVGGGVFWAGLKLIPVGYRGLILFLGMRDMDRYLESGWKWIIPDPLGGVELVYVENQNMDITLQGADKKEVLTEDQVPVSIEMSISFNHGPKVDDETLTSKEIATMLWNFVLTKSAEKQMKQEAERQLRAAISHLTIDEVHKKLEDLSTNLLHRKKNWAQFREELRANAEQKITDQKDPTPDELQKLKEVSETAEDMEMGIRVNMVPYGIHVQDVQIVNVRIPEEIEKAKAKLEREKAERLAEAEERDGVREAIKSYMDLGMSASEAAIVHQTERDKTKRTVQTVQGFDLAGLGQGVGAAIAAAVTASLANKKDEANGG